MKAYKTIIWAIAVVAAGCSNDHEYEPAQPDSPDCMGVYFDADNEHSFIFVPGEPAEVNLTLHRERTDEAADVPLIVTTTVEGVKYPQSVHFDAGSPDAQISIDCAQMPVRQQARICVNIPDEYVNHYADTHFNYETTALVSQWEPANADGSKVTFYFTESNYNSTLNPKVKSAVYQPVESEMEVLPGAGRIRVKNFLNTTVDMTFLLTPSPYESFSNYYRVSPMDNYYTMAEAYESDSYADPWYNAYFIYSDAEDDYIIAELYNLNGEPSDLSYPYLLWYSASEGYEYSYLATKTPTRTINSISMGISGTPDENGLTLPSYFYVFFMWTGESGL